MEVIKRKLSRMFSKDSSEDTKSRDECDFYSYPPYALSPKQKEHHQLFFKASNSEKFRQNVFISRPFCAYEPIHSLTIGGLEETWRLAIDKSGEKIYSTNNAAGNAVYYVLTLKKDREQVLRSVQCQYISNVRGIAVDDSDNVYVCGDHKVQKYDSADVLVASFGWDEPGGAWYQCNDPNGLFFHKGYLYVCDSRNKRIQVLSAIDLAYVSSIGVGSDKPVGGSDDSDSEESGCDGGDADDSGGGSNLVHPEDIDFDADGNMHVLDSGNLSVVVFDSHRKYSHSIALPDTQVEFPVSLRIISGHYYISDLSKSHIGVFSLAGEYIHKVMIQSEEEMEDEDEDGFVHVVASALQRPIGMAVDGNGIVYVSNIDSKEIQIF